MSNCFDNGTLIKRGIFMKVIVCLFSSVILLGNMPVLLASPLMVEVPDYGEQKHPVCFMYRLQEVSARDLFEQCRKNSLCDSQPLMLTIEKKIGENKSSVQIQENSDEDKKILTDLDHGSSDELRVFLSYKNLSFKERALVYFEKMISHPVLGPVVTFGSMYTCLLYLIMKK